MLLKKLINVVDIETFGADVTPYCISTVYCGKTVSFIGKTCMDDWFNWAFEICKNNTTFYAHNLNFDGSIILNNLPKNTEIFGRVALYNCNLYSFCIKHKDKIFRFKCSMRLLPLPLKEIAEIFDTPPKLSLDFNLKTFPDTNNKILQNSIIEYCERDVTIVNSFILKLCLSLNLSNLGGYALINRAYSLSGISLFIFKNFFNDLNIPLSLENSIDSVCRPAYYGGRCEVFGNPLQNELIYHFDFSGMYSNRLKEEFPFGAITFSNELNNTNAWGLYSVEVESFLELPILPYRDEITQKLLFPNGCFSGIYTNEELALFKENGGIILKIHWGYTFTKSGHPFKTFAEKCTSIRQNDRISKIIWKLIPNSFIGRLGLKANSEKTEIIHKSMYDPRKLKVISDKSIGEFWLVRHKIDNNESQESSGNVIYAAFVTSKARILWWKSAKKVIENGGRLLYCDTDSIFAGFTRNVMGEHHGEVFWDDKNDETEITDACFASCKMYSITYKKHGITKIKGISRKDTKMTIKKFKQNFYENKTIELRSTQFIKNFINMKIKDIGKLIDFKCYDKRIFSNNKKTTTALIINEDTLYNEKQDYTKLTASK